MKVLKGIGYWVLQLTWGIIMTFIGFVATVFSLVFLKGRIHKNGYGFITEVGGNWGGVSLGAFSLCGNYSITNKSFYDETRKHEAGHSLQNLIFGPLFPFVISIPSAIRYWYYEINRRKGNMLDIKWYKWYYKIWFESTATSWGTRYIDKIELTNED